jgi:hypothetical protein
MARTPAAKADDSVDEIVTPADAALTAIGNLLQNQQTMMERTEATRMLKVHEIEHSTHFNPDIRKYRIRKWSAFYQNHARVAEPHLSPRDIELIDQLKPGKYNHKKWEVVRTQDDGVSINYNNKTTAQRFEIARETSANRKPGYSGLTSMLEMIVTEREAQDAAKKRRGYAEDDE